MVVKWVEALWAPKPMWLMVVKDSVKGIFVVWPLMVRVALRASRSAVRVIVYSLAGLMDLVGALVQLVWFSKMVDWLEPIHDPAMMAEEACSSLARMRKPLFDT